MTEDKNVKTSFKDIVKQQLELKKEKQNVDQVTGITNKKTGKMKSQQSKKVNNSHRKMGI